MFAIAWEKYQAMESAYEKSQPGKDQNTVLDAMRIGRGTFGLKYAYLDNYSTPLLDKLVLNHGNVMELGGEQIGGLLDQSQSIAIHTTCYEKATKVMGLKAASAFWSPKYYDPLVRTLTKQILYVNEEQLQDEIRALVYLAISTKRALIIPNLLGPEAISNIGKYRNQSMWPGFRVLYIKKESDGMKVPVKVDVLEPGFYWRVDRDYEPIPEARVVQFAGGSAYPRGSRSSGGSGGGKNLMSIKQELLLPDIDSQPRVILHPRMSLSNNRRKNRSRNSKNKKEDDGDTMDPDERSALLRWANHSVGVFPRPYTELLDSYRALPNIKDIKAMGDPLVTPILNGLRLCNKIFGGYRGNRTCFQICD